MGVRRTRRVAGRRAWRLPRLPRIRAPALSIRWRRAAVLVLAALVGGVGGWWLYTSPLLSVRGVGVEGNTVLSVEAVREIADLDGQSLVRPDFAGAEERLLALPVVKDVEISRDWPNSVHIAIVERKAWGLWQAGGQRFVIDDEGVVLDLPAPEGAPVIVQTDGPSRLLAAGDRVDAGAVAVARQLVASAERTLGRGVVGLEFSQASGLSAVLSDDLRVLFGDGQGYEFKVAALYAVLEQAQAEGKTLRKVDLRFGDRVAVSEG